MFSMLSTIYIIFFHPTTTIKYNLSGFINVFIIIFYDHYYKTDLKQYKHSQFKKKLYIPILEILIKLP